MNIISCLNSPDLLMSLSYHTANELFLRENFLHAHNFDVLFLQTKV